MSGLTPELNESLEYIGDLTRVLRKGRDNDTWPESVTAVTDRLKMLNADDATAHLLMTLLLLSEMTAWTPPDAP